MTGTLNGNDTQDIILDKGSSNVLQCELLPIGLSNQLGGIWSVRINGVVDQLLSVYQNDSGAFVLPPDGTSYDHMGETVVECIYSTPDGDTIYQFNRTVQIRGECLIIGAGISEILIIDFLISIIIIVIIIIFVDIIGDHVIRTTCKVSLCIETCNMNSSTIIVGRRTNRSPCCVVCASANL